MWENGTVTPVPADDLWHTNYSRVEMGAFFYNLTLKQTKNPPSLPKDEHVVQFQTNSDMAKFNKGAIYNYEKLQKIEAQRSAGNKTANYTQAEVCPFEWNIQVDKKTKDTSYFVLKPATEYVCDLTALFDFKNYGLPQDEAAAAADCEAWYGKKCSLENNGVTFQQKLMPGAADCQNPRQHIDTNQGETCKETVKKTKKPKVQFNFNNDTDNCYHEKYDTDCHYPYKWAKWHTDKTWDAKVIIN